MRCKIVLFLAIIFQITNLFSEVKFKDHIIDIEPVLNFINPVDDHSTVGFGINLSYQYNSNFGFKLGKNKVNLNLGLDRFSVSELSSGSFNFTNTKSYIGFNVYKKGYSTFFNKDFYRIDKYFNGSRYSSRRFSSYNRVIKNYSMKIGLSSVDLKYDYKDTNRGKFELNDKGVFVSYGYKIIDEENEYSNYLTSRFGYEIKLIKLKNDTAFEMELGLSIMKLNYISFKNWKDKSVGFAIPIVF